MPQKTFTEMRDDLTEAFEDAIAVYRQFHSSRNMPVALQAISAASRAASTIVLLEQQIVRDEPTPRRKTGGVLPQG